LDQTKILNSIPLSESDKRLIEFGHDLRVDYLEILTRAAFSKERILEISTGTGRMLAILVRLCYNVFSGDLDKNLKENSLNRVKEKYLPQVSYIVMDLLRTPIKTNYQRNILSVNTIHELDNPKESLTEIIRIHHPEGKLVIADFNQLGFEIMDLAHRAAKGIPHREGSMKMNLVYETLQNYYEKIDIFETKLNTVCIATNKRQKDGI
jgi:ubiquinone/menaquinone biosynthesis C-methylase UbiE